MGLYRYDEIEKVHLEVTSRCNARCPMCARNVFGGRTSPLLRPGEISVGEARRLFDPSFVHRLGMVLICGNYGDPIAARDTVEILEHFRRCSETATLVMHTNGSGRDERWWRRLADLRVRVHFAIDGLEDTNALYRRGTDWSTIMNSVRTFIDAGGNARWEMILFAHNEHQVDEARRRSRALGFSKFKTKRTNRFFKSSFVSRKLDGTPDLSVDPKFPIKDDDGNIEGYLEMPTRPEHRNEGLSRIGAGFRALRDEDRIECQVAEERSVYVSAERLVLPCCYLGNLYAPTVNPQTDQVCLLLESHGGKDAIRAGTSEDLRRIVEGPVFRAIVERWTRPSEKRGRLKTCARVCGTRRARAPAKTS